MITIYILMATHAVQCIGAFMCEEMPVRLLTDLVATGTLEVLFEVAGVISIFRRKNHL